MGIAIGTVLGAGIALLYAPQSGLQTRAAIRQRGHTIATHGRDAWDELAEELRKTARRRMKKMRRKATRAQWAAEDWREERGW
jgi:gas vesicle protein